MKNKWKRVASMGLAFTMSIGLMAGSGMGVSAQEDITLEVEVNFTDTTLEAFREIMDGFTAETGIQIELVAPGSDYETVMKTRMASGEMPDVFVTHGWSINRYKEYLEPLTDSEWYSSVEASIIPVISDENGDIYVLPITQDGYQWIVNNEVLEMVGVKVEEILTMDDFMEVCAKVKEIGISPLFMGGKDSWLFGALYNALASAYFVAEGAVCPEAEALKNGTFDWDTNGKYVLEDIAQMVQKGYFNEDCLTANYDAGVNAFLNNECAFAYCGSGKITTINPEGNYSFIPVPATTEEGNMIFAYGEGSCFGIWKDTEYMEASKELINYLAAPENAAKILKLDGCLPAMSTLKDADSKVYELFKESEKVFEGRISYANVFDREYFPNGMWNTMSDAVVEVFMDPTETGVETARALMKDTYIEKAAVVE